jgi:hypothetical protein
MLVCLQYLLDLRQLITEIIPDYGTLLPKHVGVGTWYEVCFVIILL